MSTDMFNTLDSSVESRKRRGAAFMCGLFAQALLIGAAVLLGVLFPDQLPVSARQYVLIWLPPLTPPADPVLKPPPKVARVVVARLNSPEPPARPAPILAELVVPRIPPTISAAPARIPAPPMPAPSVAEPRPTPKAQITVHTGTFGGTAEPVTTQRPKQEVQTGGFGSPQGLPGRAQGGNPGNVPKLGSFGLPEGPGVGNGTGGRFGIQGVVASAGFGSGIAGSGYGRGGSGGTEGSKVMMGGFEKVAQVSQSPLQSPHAPPTAEFQPVEILSKPSPIYTEEARRMGIQGEVALSVVFQANGAIRITGVVSSLGHGLDQAAQQAASQIRFKPAQHDGQPADFPATLRIEFRLADQST